MLIKCLDRYDIAMFDRLTSNHVSVDDSNTNRLIIIIARCRYKDVLFTIFESTKQIYKTLFTYQLLPCDIGVAVADSDTSQLPVDVELR